jgi:hypothetical protein
VVSRIEWALLPPIAELPGTESCRARPSGKYRRFPFAGGFPPLSWVPFAPDPDTDSLTDNARHWCYENHQGLVYRTSVSIQSETNLAAIT